MATSSTVTIAARLDRLPSSSYVRKLILLISLGGWFEFYDLFFTAAVGAALVKSGLFKIGPNPFEIGSLASFVAALFTGLFIGTIAFSWLSDRFGRRSIFTFALLWYSIGSLILAFQQTALGVDLCRMIACIGLGVELVNVDTYVSELVPKEQRAARPGFRLQSDGDVHGSADHRAAGVADGAALHLPRPRGLALGGDHRLRRRRGDLVDPPQPAGIAALAGAAWPYGGGRAHYRRYGASHRGPDRQETAGAATG